MACNENNPDATHTYAFLFIDALGWEIVQRSAFMAQQLPHRRCIEMQFGYSCSAIPTILTGKRPDQHGHLSLFRYAPEESPFRNLSRWCRPLMHPRSFWERGRVRHWLSKALKRLLGFTGYFQLYQMKMERLGMMDYCEKKDLFAPKAFPELENLADLLLRSGLPHHISDWHLGDEANLQRGAEAIRKGTPFLFIYTAELDGILHDHVGDESIIAKRLEWYESRIQSLFAAAKESGRQLHLTIFSDHGMTPLAGTVDLLGALEKTGLQFGKDYGLCCDSTLLRVTYLTPAAREVIHQAIQPYQHAGHWLTLEEERYHGIYREDRRFGDELFLTAPGVQIVPSDMGKKPLNGMHGFDPAHPDSNAAILSTDAIPDFVQRVADYYPLMATTIKQLQTASTAQP